MIPPVRVERVDSRPVHVEIPRRRRGWFAANMIAAVIAGIGGAAFFTYGISLL